MSSDELQRLLNQTQEPGAERFTLDLAHALEKNSGYRLANPRNYILKMIQWAVASDATSVKIFTDRTEIRVEHDGRPLTRSKASRLRLLDGDPETRDLAMGLQTALGLGSDWARVSSWDEQGGYEFELVGSSFALRSIPQADKIIVCVQGVPSMKLAFAHNIIGSAMAAFFGVAFAGKLGLPRAWALGLGGAAGATTLLASTAEFLNGGPAHVYPELALIRRGCEYAPIPIFVDDVPINRPLFGLKSDHNYSGSILRVQPNVAPSPADVACLEESGCRVPGIASTGDELPHLWAFGRPMRGCRAAFLRERGEGVAYPKPTTIHWVKNGVTVALSYPGGPAGFTVVACANDLEVDFSQFSVVENAAYQVVLQRITEALHRHA
jgi:hypothetical protein